MIHGKCVVGIGILGKSGRVVHFNKDEEMPHTIEDEGILYEYAGVNDGQAYYSSNLPKMVFQEYLTVATHLEKEFNRQIYSEDKRR